LRGKNFSWTGNTGFQGEDADIRAKKGTLIIFVGRNVSPQNGKRQKGSRQRKKCILELQRWKATLGGEIAFK